ncbi:phosphopentomutase [Thiotrichales bacterium 19S3-7]|nr:phosphopentomutase [Thiotrichales bacterium 19S3-7]MCF6800599.1 phosphopentomutase [Thiotrichales bacterium 19S3-11]
MSALSNVTGRVVILLMDSFGIGYSEDADRYGDVGADTLGHIVDFCANAKADTAKRNGALYLPNLARRGLERAACLSRGKPLKHSLGYEGEPAGYFGYAKELSLGKDTPSGHWEIAGVPVLFDWHYFEHSDTGNTFPKEFLQRWIEAAQLTDGVLDAGHASGTEVINRLGDLHCQTKKPIVYTSADSVFQIAAHEQHFGLERLYEISQIARRVLDEMDLMVGRVIARPFLGENANYTRTGNRHDYSILPPEPTLLDYLTDAGGNVISIGKIADIYAHQGISKNVKATGLDDLFNQTLCEFKNADQGSLIFTNFVDFDSSYGHRRDVTGYAEALEYLDRRLPELDALLGEHDLVVVAADHGCDPTWPGTDHTREHIPVLAWGKDNALSVEIGKRNSFADIGQSIASFMGLKPLKYGQSFLV